MDTGALLTFLKDQKLAAIASCQNKLWIANVYYGIDEAFRMYFISPADTEHSRQILKSPDIAFSVAWYDPANPGNRKAVQGTGKCVMAEAEADIRKGVELHNRNFPQFKETLTPDYLLSNEEGVKVWIIEPAYVKFWNDELYGEEEWEEYAFPR